MRIRLTLEYSSPENIVSANTGDSFFRRGDSFFLINSKGINSLNIQKRLFVANDARFKRIAYSSLLNSYDIFFSKSQELWVKSASKSNKTGWKYMGTKSPVISNPPPIVVGIGSGTIYVTYE